MILTTLIISNSAVIVPLIITDIDIHIAEPYRIYFNFKPFTI